jgi:serine protease AprX
MLDTRYFRGTGTSEATAIVSGAVALVLQKYPTLTPDAVKAFFKANTFKLTLGQTEPQAQGNGEMQLAKMLTATPATAKQSFTSSTGLGTLEGARGTDHLTLNGVVLEGEKDIFGKPFSSAAMATAAAAGSSWSGGTWNGSTWSGSTWSGSSWSGSTWSGSSWSGSTWSDSTWSGNSWSGSTWSGSTWSGNSWSGNSWSGNTWSGGSWQGATWD